MPKTKKGEQDKDRTRSILDPLEPRPLSLDYKPKQRRHCGPLASTSPTRSAFQIHHPKPFSPGRRHSYLPPADRAPADVVLKRSQSLNTHAQRPAAAARSQSVTEGIPPPHFETSALQKQSTRRKPISTTAKTTVVAVRPVSTAPERDLALRPPKPARTKVGRKPPQTHHTQGTADILGEILADRTGSYANRPRLSPPSTVPSLCRTGSLVQKMSAKMAYQPTMPDTKATSAASAASAGEREHRSRSSRKHRSRPSRPYADTIDSLDRVGGFVYHHEGPYDATLAAVNKNKKKSPLEAVKDSNMEALKATPPEYIKDSLTKHVPLQGTSNVPSGMPDRYGNVLHYTEGADLMREADAPGGAYRRYDFVQYHPDDLKGKGEPSYSIEKAIKEGKAGKLRKQRASFSDAGPGAFEMRPTSSSSASHDQAQARAPLLPGKDASASVRRSSFSQGSASGSCARGPAEPAAIDSNANHGGLPGESGRARSGSGSHRFTDGIKRRFGSLRKK